MDKGRNINIEDKISNPKILRLHIPLMMYMFTLKPLTILITILCDKRSNLRYYACDYVTSGWGGRQLLEVLFIINKDRMKILMPNISLLTGGIVVFGNTYHVHVYVSE